MLTVNWLRGDGCVLEERQNEDHQDDTRHDLNINQGADALGCQTPWPVLMCKHT